MITISFKVDEQEARAIRLQATREGFAATDPLFPLTTEAVRSLLGDSP